MDSSHRRLIQFGTFEVDLSSGELRRSGRPVKLQDQPFRLLALLLEHPGEIVSREELQEKIWGPTFVDFEEGLNTAVRKLRDALGDSATNPRFIETLPRRGYRFIAPVQSTGDPGGKSKEAGQSSVARWRYAVAAIVLALGTYLVARDSPTRSTATFLASPLVQITRDSGLTIEPAISRDGKLVAYASDRSGDDNLDIWLQPIAGGAPVRLTADPAADEQPEFSPDSTEVLFRSKRDGGGIYSVPAHGGESRLVVRNGLAPRFSPDGTKLAYEFGTSGAGGFTGNLHVLTHSTGATIAIAPNLYIAGPAAWSPSGKSLVFAASRNALLRPLHFWICSADGGSVVQLSEKAIDEDPTVFGQIGPVSVAWIQDDVILSLKQGDTSNLWTAKISENSRKLSGELKRLTLGSGNEAMPAISMGGRLVFANVTYSTGIWELKPRGDATAEMRRLTRDHAMNYRPSVSTDGSRLAYVSNRTGNFDVWLRDLTKDTEAALTRTKSDENFVALSRDGEQVAFWDGVRISTMPSKGGSPRVLCEHCGRPDDWSPDGRIISSPGMDRLGIAWLTLSAPSPELLTVHEHLYTTAPNLSRDGRWLTFHIANPQAARQPAPNRLRQIFVAPYSGKSIPQSDWIAVTDGPELDREARWSADGSEIYFLSDRDGFRCIWARKFDAIQKRPVGPIYPLVHLHSPQVSLLHVPNTGNVSISPVRGKMYLAIGELTGNLWMTDLQRN